jgi:hypothetical protein
MLKNVKRISIFIVVVAFFVPVLISWKTRGWFAKYDSPPYSFDDIPNLQGKFAIVTGANTGIGKVDLNTSIFNYVQ